MGGRVASCYAAAYPSRIGALIIEDMDIAVRTNQVQMDESTVIGFNRSFPTKESAIIALVDAGYDEKRVEKWIDEGRLKQTDDTSWWSDVNPEARMLCYSKILISTCGEEAIRKISSESTAEDFQCYLMKAELGSACSDSSVLDMKRILGDRLSLKEYANSYHSIHNTAQDEFVSDLMSIVKQTSSL